MGNKKAVAIEMFGFKLCKALLEEGATYASIILSKNNSIVSSYSTNQVWEGLYHVTGFSKSCHLYSTTQSILTKSESFTLFWDSLTPNNELSHYLNEKRKEKNICHGVSFCDTNRYGFLEILSIAGRECDLNFASQVLANKSKIQRQIIGLQEKYLSQKSIS